MQRVLVYSHDDQPLFELSPLEVYGLDRKEAINGEHSLTIRTTRVLEKGQRILTLDNRNRWREHVVYGTDESHESGNKPIGEYYCVWSLMHDLMGTTVSRMPGVQTPVMAGVALDAALSGTARWVAGTVTNSNLGGASMYDMGGWEAMQVMTKTWGGEVDVTIEVGLAGVVSRKVDYYDAQGEHVAKRRFDFGADLKGVRRKIPDGPIFCRISPRGKGEQTEGGGYGRKITIESVNGGKDWLQNDQLAPFVALPDGNGGWEYPKRIVENSQIETPEELKEWGLSVLDEYTVPKVSYEVDAVQVAIEGVDVQGVSLGDQVQVVDAKFGGLRLTARVVSIETDMLDELSVKVKLGYIGENVGTMFTKLQGDIASVSAAVEAVRSGTEMTDTYLQRLVARLNQEINATGGYWYLIEGLGTRTYDTAVSDPTVGAEASKVIEMRGGSLRIADSKDAQGNWEFDTVFVSGHIAAQLVTAAHLEAGYIGSPTSGNYWNLDTGEFQMAATSTLGGKTVQQIIDGVDATITGTDMEYAQGTSPTQEPTSGWQTQPPAWEAGKYIWQRLKTTTAAGASYSDPVMISGKDGVDGTSVTILGSYNTLAELQAAHPTGSDGDAYMVAGDLYVWNGSAWEDVGQIQGQRGPAGANGESNYIHTAWANSQDGTTDFSTTVSAGKSYLGVCTDQNTADPTTPSSYSWSKIEGDAGADGVGISSITEQFARSTSTTPPAKTSTAWQDDQPSYQTGYYYFSRSKITWDNGTVGYTDGILARAITSANQNAAAAQAAANTANNTLATLNTQEGVFNKLTNNGQAQGLYMSNGQLYINGTYMKIGKISSANRRVYFDLDNNELRCDRLVSTDSTNNAIAQIGKLTLSGGGSSTRTYIGQLVYSGSDQTNGILLHPGSSSAVPTITSPSNRIRIECISNQGGGLGYGYPGIIVTKKGYTVVHGATLPLTESSAVSSTSNNDAGRVICHPAYTGSSSYTMDGKVEINGSLTATRFPTRLSALTVTGSKSRSARTDNYGDRLLYCDETPSPTFTDFGGGRTDEDGLCYVEIDGIFAETVRTDMAYQVFLQACGEGDLWVEGKTPTYFIVHGTPNLAFDWQLKARQKDYETMRLEDEGIDDALADGADFFAGSMEAAILADLDSIIESIEDAYETEETNEAA